MAKPKELKDYIHEISEFLDENIYESLFNFEKQNGSAASIHLINKLCNGPSFKQVSARLEKMKVASVVLGILSSLMVLRKGASNPIVGVFYLALAHDCLRVSYNSYHKKYLAMSFSCLVGNISSFATTGRLFNLSRNLF
jgi:hypothetical protein